jgi:nicotinate-nucleotide pyrophosphorylase (carboxylating)
MCEVDTLEQLDTLLTLPPGSLDIVLLDNMSVEQLCEAAKRRDARAPKLELEASGGVTLDTIAAIATTGVDRISVGALTHSAVHLDVALDIDA